MTDTPTTLFLAFVGYVLSVVVAVLLRERRQLAPVRIRR